MHIQNLIEIHKLIYMILSINKNLTSIKGHNSVKIYQKLTCNRYNMDLVYINAYKIFIKLHPFVLKILRKNTFLHHSSAITILFINEFSPFAIPNHSSLIAMSMQSLKKIGRILLKLESGNEALTDGRTLQLFGFRGFSNGHFTQGFRSLFLSVYVLANVFFTE